MTDISKFEPVNKSEELLVTACRARTPPELNAFLKHFIDDKAVILLDQPIDESKPNNNMNPLFIPNRLSGYRVLAMFTSTERASLVLKGFPTYSYGFETSAKWLIKCISPECGLVINPGSACCFEMDPERVAELKKEYAI